MTAPLELRSGTPAGATLTIEERDGREYVAFRLELGPRRGAITPADGDTLVAAAAEALSTRRPLVMVLASSGADATTGVAGLDGWGRAARAVTRCSGVVPVIAAVTGPAVSGSALLVGLADHVVMTRSAYAFVSGPVPVRMMTGVGIGVDELGGSGIHDRATGVASLVVADDAEEVEQAIADMLAFLPDHVDELPPAIVTADPAGRPTPEAGDTIPDLSMGSYDVRQVVVAIVDDGFALELKANWAPNLVTAFASIGGRPVGVVANQPLAMAGTLDIPASQKGARFVSFCDAFNLPLVTFVDTPGFYPGKDLEWRGMIRHGAQMAFAYARASTPRVAVVLRKSYGGAYIVMDSKSMGNDAYIAWPTAEIAVMGANQAAEILYRRETPENRAERVLEYEDRYLNPYVAAERGFIDAVIDPSETRAYLADTLDLLATKRERLPSRRHDNTPL